MASLQFDIFCSYAHGDNDDGWVDRFVDGISGAHRKLTGEAPRLFMDRGSIVTADVWEQKILGALQESQVLVAVMSPSYVRSEWCRREWNAVAEREAEFRQREVLSDEQGLIFPVLLYPLDRGRFGESEQEFARAVEKRQWLDVSSRSASATPRPEQVRLVAEQIIDATSDLQHRLRSASRGHVTRTAETTIRDRESRIEWAAELSPVPMGIDDVPQYLHALSAQGSRGWRLPTREELESIIDQDAVVEGSEASPYPLREPFNAQRSGYLHSSTPVGAYTGNYIMNVRNGHIFNGHGYEAFVRAVRDIAA